MSASDDADIARLAALAGIEPGYRDTGGVDRPISPETKHAVLQALGFDPDSRQAVRDAIAGLEETPWQQMLPPTVVLHPAPGPGPTVPLTLPQAALAGPLAWRIELEGGATRSGATALAAASWLGQRREAGGTRVRIALTLPSDLPPGYHRLHVQTGTQVAAATLVQTPAAAFLPDWLTRGERKWGLACPLFALWSEASWGIGDFSDLGRTVRLARELGASIVGLNPLHAPLPGPDADPNPYRPSSRLFLNPLHIDVTTLAPGIAPPAGECFPPAGQGVDYAAVYRAKHAALAELHRSGQGFGADGEFQAFRRDHGETLRRFALFNTLGETFGPLAWADWPAAVRTPTAPGIAAFAQEQAERIDYHIWLQWVADRQLATAAAAADGASGGIYRDLAIGVHPSGADVWADPNVFASGASVGAPPDAFNAEGQDWGLPPPSPRTLAATGYAGFIAAVRANMRHAQVLRIDHVMGLQRLFWIPGGGSARDGAYVRYPFDDLLGILALESRRQRCLLVGEDLGTIPDGFRERLAAANVLSYRLLMFERHASGLFRRPGCYPSLAVAAFSTHDLPPVRGWWQGSDLPPTASAATVAERRHDRIVLLAALRDRGLIRDWPTENDLDDPRAVEALILAVHRFLARAPSALMLANIGDLLAETAQINRPGAAEGEHNWRHRFRTSIETLATDELVRRCAEAITAGRQGDPDRER